MRITTREYNCSLVMIKMGRNHLSDGVHVRAHIYINILERERERKREREREGEHRLAGEFRVEEIVGEGHDVVIHPVLLAQRHDCIWMCLR